MIKTWWDSPEGHIGNVVFYCGVDLCRWQIGVRWSLFCGEWDVVLSFLCFTVDIGRWL